MLHELIQLTCCLLQDIPRVGREEVGEVLQVREVPEAVGVQVLRPRQHRQVLYVLQLRYHPLQSHWLGLALGQDRGTDVAADDPNLNTVAELDADASVDADSKLNADAGELPPEREQEKKESGVRTVQEEDLEGTLHGVARGSFQSLRGLKEVLPGVFKDNGGVWELPNAKHEKPLISLKK